MKKIIALLLIATLVAGCQPAKPTSVVMKSAPANTAGKGEHDHGAGPHQGTIIELGKYHGEFTVDHKKKEVTVYILGDDADTPAPVVAEKLMLTIKSPAFSVELKPQPDPKDPAGKCSRFVATHDNFGKEQEFEGTVAGSIDGKPAEGTFKEKDEHGHKKEKNDKKK